MRNNESNTQRVRRIPSLVMLVSFAFIAFMLLLHAITPSTSYAAAPSASTESANRDRILVQKSFVPHRLDRRWDKTFLENYSQPSALAVTHTVGLDSAACAATQQITVTAFTDVFFCLAIRNQSNVTLTTHHVTRVVALGPMTMTERYTFNVLLGPDTFVAITQDILSATFGITDRFVIEDIHEDLTVNIDFAATDGATILRDTSRATVTVQAESLYLPVIGTPPAFAAERALWAQQQIASYRMMQQVSCFCPPPLRGIVVVNNDEIVSVLDPDTEEPFDSKDWSRFETVNELFDRLERAAARPAHQLKAQFDPTQSYPTSISIDYEELVADDEIGITVENLTQR